MTNGYGAYQRIQAETSTPQGLISLLYTGLQTDLRRAEVGLLSGNTELVNARLARAQEIVLELLVSLDHSQGAIPAQLAALYDYMYRQLLQANMQKDLSIVRELSVITDDLAGAWAVAIGVASQRAA